MSNENFTEIAKRYRGTSVVQSSAADILFSLLKISDGESVLDIGCGTGNLTKKIRALTSAPITGIDPSEGMIRECVEKYGADGIRFIRMDAQDMDFENEFDVIFCNSTFQWFRDPSKGAENMRRALKPGGRAGIQAPAMHAYCPQFIDAVRRVKNNPAIGEIFTRWANPWYYRDTAQEYANIFTGQGFRVEFAEIQSIESSHTPEQAYDIFASGAIAGYLNRDYYEGGYEDFYAEEFRRIVRQSLVEQAGADGNTRLVFNRIFLIAVRV
ncbi:MAG: methyltransferase domain-containing protein [Brevinematales bacterium]|nr:methyltransferase domain-containing protein [Brevinematales bacterium]